MVLALSLVESALSWSRFLCASRKRTRQGRRQTRVTCVGGERGRRSGAGGKGAHRPGAHLKRREVRGGRGLLEELGGGVEEPCPPAHLRVTPASAAATADAGHRRRGRRFRSWFQGRRLPARRWSLWGFSSAEEGRSGGAFCEMAPGLGSRVSSFFPFCDCWVK